VPNAFRAIAPVPWMVDLYFSAMKRNHSVLAPRELIDLAAFVACQEASCRYCYGGMRAFMRMLGYREKELRSIENRVELDELSPLERATIDFASSLVRMANPPGAAARTRFAELGLDDAQVAELSFAVAQVVASTRITMLLAVQPDVDFEKMPESFLFGRLLRPLLVRGFRAERRPLARVADGPFASLLAPLGETWGGQILRRSIDGLLGEGPLPPRTKLLILLVIGHATGARRLRDEAARLLADGGFDSEKCDEVTAHLSSPALDPLESKLVPLARDTI
jgi:alkylhydroperoxidase family enzyme